MSSTLDRLVAEKVMGWTCTTDEDDDGPSWIEYKEGRCVSGIMVRDWNPSTNMNQAMAVVDKMSDTTKETWNISVFSSGAKVAFDYDGMRDKPWYPGEYEEWAPSIAELPAAICRVALAAVGVEYKGSDNG